MTAPLEVLIRWGSIDERERWTQKAVFQPEREHICTVPNRTSAA